ncbi:MAG: 2-amino-4-hydroxy-6-hydroxymethyldihydropteridine diphosphokinase [Bacteroidales bacterium]|nr:2-amino-4-hydroxy-6-hydroxymethyldihydropteridine diphosphokinase [Bacteroidales bacterium]
MERVDVYLGLGSNEGNRDLNLLKAVNLLDQAFGTHPERISKIVETPSWGFEGPDFLNMCLLYRIPRKGSPEEQATEILRIAKDVEKAMGRTEELEFAADGSRIYHNRIIDVDILCYGAHVIKTEALTVPHPLIGQRDFVKKPLLEISKPEIRNAFPEIFD